MTKTKFVLLSLSFVLIFLMGSSLIPFVNASKVNSPLVVEIYSIAKDDPYSRYVGLTFDNQMPQRFWEGEWYEQNQEAVLGTPWRGFYYTTTVDLPKGKHTLEYAVSSYVGCWKTIVLVNGEMVSSGNVTVDNHLVVNFVVDENNNEEKCPQEKNTEPEDRPNQTTGPQLVVPEIPFGPLVGFFASLSAFGMFYYLRKHQYLS